jgi:hypothetical protein
MPSAMLTHGAGDLPRFARSCNFICAATARSRARLAARNRPCRGPAGSFSRTHFPELGGAAESLEDGRQLGGDDGVAVADETAGVVD